jgi:RND family efflux transporter MFP subunit
MKNPKTLAWIAGIVLLGGVLWMWAGRSRTQGDRFATANSDLPATAAVTNVARRDLNNGLTLAGEFKPFQAIDVHAKVAGYIRQIYVDVGDHVKRGQTIAVLEVPELAAQVAGADAAVRAAQEQIRRAQGDLQRSKSMHDAAHSAYVRLKSAADSRAGLVAQQDVDDAQAKDVGLEGQVASAEAELSGAKQQLEVAQASQKQYKAMADYTHITAPFAGVVTNRYADTGALVAAGTSSSTQAIPVVRLAETSKLRLVLPVPESAARQVHLGDQVTVNVQVLSENFVGKVARFSDALDMQTRTMQTEIDVENRNGRLIPGMYAETQLALQPKKGVLTIPLQAVTRNSDDATVYAVNAQNAIEERHVTLGADDGINIEVLSGLSELDRVILGNRNLFHPGQKIEPKQVSAPNGVAGGVQ